MTGSIVRLEVNSTNIDSDNNFANLSDDLAVHVFGSKPRYISRDDVPKDILD